MQAERWSAPVDVSRFNYADSLRLRITSGPGRNLDSLHRVNRSESYNHYSLEGVLMDSVCVNYWAVLVSAAAYFVLGAVWYSPVMFGNAWMKLLGWTKEQAQQYFSPRKLVFVFVLSLFVAYGIARILCWTDLEPLWGGFAIGLTAGLNFVALAFGINDLMEARPVKLFLINAAYHLIGFVGMGLIIGAWR